ILLEPDPLHGNSPLVCSRSWGRERLVFGSIVNAAAEGKRLRAIDAFIDLKWQRERQQACLISRLRGPLTRRLGFGLGLGGGVGLRSVGFGRLRCGLVAG